MLSHGNLLANRYQLAALIDFNSTDIVFNALPIFHSFGLTAGTLLPMLSGIKTFLYPSPLHYRIVPVLVYDTDATIMFGTDTFLAGYAKVAHAYDFYSVRYVFAGAEKVKDETRRVWSEKFGIRILEGYGATETAPVISTNTPMHFKAGTVGRIIPGMSHALEPVPGIDEGGKLIVSGPNIMLGYARASMPSTTILHRSPARASSSGAMPPPTGTGASRRAPRSMWRFSPVSVASTWFIPGGFCTTPGRCGRPWRTRPFRSSTAADCSSRFITIRAGSAVTGGR